MLNKVNMLKKVQILSRSEGLVPRATAWGVVAGLCVASMLAIAAPGGDAGSATAPARPSSTAKPSLDRSGRAQVGKASFYASRYSGRTMADGTPMRLYSSNAASLTLPLGTTAEVRNLQTGLSAVVTIRDRGPYVAGRIIDLSPATARKIGLERKQGLAKVEVTPLTIPLVDGTVWVVAQQPSKQPVVAAN
ncbi:MAG: septal ring lytic transglycosylase RlpA family protein [Steroidobacteraceae bacterium]|jgi:rare lipoprotein A